MSLATLREQAKKLKINLGLASKPKSMTASELVLKLKEDKLNSKKESKPNGSFLPQVQRLTEADDCEQLD